MSQVGARLVYDNAKGMLAKAGFNTQRAILSQSFLRLEQAMVTNKTVFSFPVLTNDQGSTFKTEQRLKLQDAFIVSSLFVGFATPENGTVGKSPIRTYPDPGANGFTGDAYKSAQILYNGKLVVTVNNRTVIPAWDLLRHLYVPQTQAVSPLTNQQDGNTSGFVAMEPNLTIGGAKNTQVNIELPEAFTDIVADSRLVIIARGILAQGVTSVK